MTSRARLILNPSSGSESAPLHLDTINQALRAKYGSMEIVVTVGGGDAEAAARVAVSDGCDVLFVAGGDGTLNEALNGVASAGALGAVTLGVIPLGTGNDFAAALGIPSALDDALRVLLEGREIRADVGEVNGRVFANISGGGYIAEVSEAVTPEMKTIAGRLAYLVGGAQALMDFEPVRVTAIAAPGGQRFATAMYAYAVCNSRLIGGGKLIAPHASIDDGLLDLCVIDEMPTLEFIALLRRVAKGDHVDDSRVRYLRVERVSLEFSRRVKVNTDGELLDATACEYRVRPGAARFFAGDETFTVSGGTGNSRG
ncbi:MAG: diacylglycerol/lipid kinase family protein [Thermoanaerobaculia bacterium]